MKINRGHLKWLIPLSVAAILALLTGWNPESHSGLPDKVDFNYHIRPILTNNCFACHGPDVSTREAGLRLDNFEDATTSLKEGRLCHSAGQTIQKPVDTAHYPSGYGRAHATCIYKKATHFSSNRFAGKMDQTRGRISSALGLYTTSLSSNSRIVGYHFSIKRDRSLA